jgi:phenylalanyl-tRNA synthetase beta chain
MRVPLSWLAELTDVSARPEDLAARLTAAGLECSVAAAAKIPEGVVTGKIVSCERHPDADRLSVCRVDVGASSLLPIVCGAPNAEAGRVGAVALLGTELGPGFVIQRRKVRGVTSEGMLCSEKELGLSDEASGILLLPADTEIGRPLGEALGAEPALVTEPTSNRGDLMSVEGVAREIAATSGRSFEPRAREIETVKRRASWKIDIEHPQDCARYSGRVIQGVEAGPSPAWMARRLAAAGVRPLWNLVDATNYVLLELGHPLHAFDLDELEGRTIGVRCAGSGERITTLDGKPRELGSETLVIADGSGPIAIAGIMGGQSTMVTESTTNVFLEGASFSAARVRSGARALRLVTDASARFERGVDPEGVPRALDRCCDLLLELCPGARVLEAADSYPGRAKQARVRLRRATLRRILGIDVAGGEVRRIFGNLGFDVSRETKGVWDVVVPTRRRDVTAEEDLVEEVARIHGYDQIPERATARVRPVPLRHPRVESFFRARQMLLRLGLDEVVTPSLVDGETESALVEPSSFFGQPVPLRNPLSADRSHLRSTLVPSLLRVLATNFAQSLPDLAVFEIGRTFRRAGASQVTEHQHVAMLLSGLGLERARGMGAKSCDFFDMKGLLEVYVEQFWESRASFEGPAPRPLSAERSATVVVGGEIVGVLGEIGQDARKAFELPPGEPVLLAELDLEARVAVAAGTRLFEPLPRYPGVVRDLAFVVPRSRRHGEVEAGLREAGGDLLAELRLFDVYEGAPLDEGEKSLAYTLVFRSQDRSLTNEEVDERVDKLVQRMRRLDARLR